MRQTVERLEVENCGLAEQVRVMREALEEASCYIGMYRYERPVTDRDQAEITADHFLAENALALPVTAAEQQARSNAEAHVVLNDVLSRFHTFMDHADRRDFAILGRNVYDSLINYTRLVEAQVRSNAEAKDLLLQIISLSPDDNSYMVALLRACKLLGIDMPKCPVIDEIESRNWTNAEQAARLAEYEKHLQTLDDNAQEEIRDDKSSGEASGLETELRHLRNLRQIKETQ